MFKGRCLKCDWKGKSTDCSAQWFTLDEETSELLLICPACKTGVVVGLKAKGEQYDEEISKAYQDWRNPYGCY